MRDRHDAGAARRDEPRCLLDGGVVRAREVHAAEGLAAVHRRVGHHHADETDRDRPHADHVVTRQLEPGAHVRPEAYGLELLQAIPELLGREVVLVVAEDDVRHADGVEAVDHAAPGIDAREEARSEEVTGEHDDERVAVGPRLVVIDERLQPGEVLERIDVVDGDDAEAGHLAVALSPTHTLRVTRARRPARRASMCRARRNQALGRWVRQSSIARSASALRSCSVRPRRSSLRVRSEREHLAPNPRSPSAASGVAGASQRRTRASGRFSPTNAGIAAQSVAGAGCPVAARAGRADDERP